MGTSGRAAVGVVTEGVDVHAAFGTGVVAGDVPCDGGWGRLGGLLERDGSRDLGVSSDGGNCVARAIWSARMRANLMAQ